MQILFCSKFLKQFYKIETFSLHVITEVHFTLEKSNAYVTFSLGAIFFIKILTSDQGIRNGHSGLFSSSISLSPYHVALQFNHCIAHVANYAPGDLRFSSIICKISLSSFPFLDPPPNLHQTASPHACAILKTRSATVVTVCGEDTAEVLSEHM